MALAKKDPEKAKEWLRMTIRLETSMANPNPDFIAHLEEGIEIINLWIDLATDPNRPPGFTLEDLPDWGDPETWPTETEDPKNIKYYHHETHNTKS